MIFYPGDYTDNIYLIDSGYVRIYHITGNGTRVTVAIRYPGDIIGLVEPLFQTKIKYYIEGFRDVRLIKTNRQKIIQKMKENSEFAISLVKILGRRLREAQEISCVKSVLLAEFRLAMLLKELTYKCGAPYGDKIQIMLKLTQEEMASIIGTSRQTINTLLKYFRKKQAIITTNGKMLVDPIILSEIIGEYKKFCVNGNTFNKYF